MTASKAYKKKVDAEFEDFVTNGFDVVESIEKSLSDLFSFKAGELSKAEASFEASMAKSGYDTSNDTVEKGLVVTRDYLAAGINKIMTLERFIIMHIPAIEDGNNFGVSVQMVVLKILKETREDWTKKLETLPSYYSTRADAVDKLNLVKVTQTETLSESNTNSAGGKDGDESKKTSTTSKEEKKTGGASPDVARIKHLVAIDLKWYFELQASLIALQNGYIAIHENIEKNKNKLTTPKGSNGGRSSMSMY